MAEPVKASLSLFVDADDVARPRSASASPRLLRLDCSEWDDLRASTVSRASQKQYVIFAADPFRDMALRLQAYAPLRFRYFPIDWNKYPDGTDNITIAGFTPTNHIASSNILFFASFHNNDVTLSQFSVLIVLLQSFIESMTIVLPFYPVGTNERVTVEGKVATANTYSTLLSSLPNIGRPSRLMIYDIHALQERFYFHNSTLPSLHSSVPLLLDRLRGTGITTVTFPDDGAAKRYGSIFQTLGFDLISCGKVRDGDKRNVTIAEGDPAGKKIVIVDDLVQTGGTLYECALALRQAGAVSVNAFVAHAVFPNQSWKRFCQIEGGERGDRAIFDYFWVTNSIPPITDLLPKGSCFEVLDLCSQIRKDLDIHK